MKNLNEDFEVHDYLNPAFWTSKNELLPEVKNTILNIVNRYKNDTSLPLDIVDIWLVGSNASYNYTDNSDLDIHMIVNFDQVDCDPEILKTALQIYTKKFGMDYPNLRVRGFDVELYIQDMDSTIHSNGIYSVLQNKWIKFPEKLTNIPKFDVSQDVNRLAAQTEKVLALNNLPDVVKQLDKIYMIRKIGIAEQGEFGKQNQVFKELRNLGYIDKLKSKIKELKEKALILENKNN